MELIRKYTLNEVSWWGLNIGDSIQLPEFTIPKTVIKGNVDLHFDEMTINDTITVYNIKHGKVYLVFNHALFSSAIDLTGATKWKKSQLYEYLNGIFRDSIHDLGVPIWKASLLSTDEVFGDHALPFPKDALPFFKDGRNRIAFTKVESRTVPYWLKDLYMTDMADFYIVDRDGDSNCDDIYSTDNFVRPCFTVKID